MSLKQLGLELTAFLSSLLTTPVNASNATVGIISHFYVFQIGAASFSTTGARSSDIPACASTTPQQ